MIIVKTGLVFLVSLSEELEDKYHSKMVNLDFEIILLDGNENIEILTTSQSQHLRENTIFVDSPHLTIIYKINSPDDTE